MGRAVSAGVPLQCDDVGAVMTLDLDPVQVMTIFRCEADVGWSCAATVPFAKAPYREAARLAMICAAYR